MHSEDNNMESQSMSPMPQYKCHKTVYALRITGVIVGLDGSILCVEAPFAPKGMSAEWCNKHKPYAGGYYIQYEDGYESFSPAKAFEEGYTRV